MGFFMTGNFPDSTSLFSDSDHLNASGAQLFSEVFANFYTGKIPEEELFYDTYHAKLEALPPTIYGLNYHDVTDSNTKQSVRNASIVASCKANLEYQIVMSPENSTPYTIQDFSAKDNFDISPTEHGVCTITSREIDNQNILQTINIDY